MIKTEAIILKSADSNEVDRLLTIYSEEMGKINISAKGVKKLESKLRYSIEPISWVQMILVEGKNSLILKDTVIKDQLLNIKKDLGKIKIAKKITDLIDEAIAGQEKDDDVWRLILMTLKALNEDKISFKSAVVDFQNNLIKILGYDPEAVRELKDIY